MYRRRHGGGTHRAAYAAELKGNYVIIGMIADSLREREERGEFIHSLEITNYTFVLVTALSVRARLGRLWSKAALLGVIYKVAAPAATSRIRRGATWRAGARE